MIYKQWVGSDVQVRNCAVPRWGVKAATSAYLWSSIARCQWCPAGTADVHSPGLPRDCAALEASEPDLSTLLANNSSQENLADAVADTAGNNYSSAVDTSEGDVELALSRLQEVRHPSVVAALLSQCYYVTSQQYTHPFRCDVSHCDTERPLRAWRIR